MWHIFVNLNLKSKWFHFYSVSRQTKKCITKDLITKRLIIKEADYSSDKCTENTAIIFTFYRWTWTHMITNSKN